MFHSFEGLQHPAMPGAISADQLSEILTDADRRYKLHDAADWARKARKGQLAAGDVCITFDDGLRCQFDVALPVLASFDRTAFWFCPGAPLEGRLIRSDIHKLIIATHFKDFDAFFDAFQECCAETRWKDAFEQAISLPDAESYLSEWKFYSRAERLYRYVRDIQPGDTCCNEVFDQLIVRLGFSYTEVSRQMWLSSENLEELEGAGHVIGLHSYNHPMRLDLLDADMQLEEYQENARVLCDILARAPDCVSHPCNAFTDATLSILERMGMRVGFRADMNGPVSPHLDHRRIDHMYYLEEIAS